MLVPIPPPRLPETGSPLAPVRRRSGVVWLALGSNALLLCAGGVLLLFAEGEIEPQWAQSAGQGFLVFTLLAGCGGCFLSAVVSVSEMTYRGKLWTGIAGLFLSLMLWFAVLTVGKFLDFGFDK